MPQDNPGEAGGAAPNADSGGGANPNSAAPNPEPGAGAAPGAGGSPAAAPGSAPASDWTAGLDDAARQVAAAKGWKGPNDAISSYQQLEKSLGYDKLALPPKNADGARDWDGWEGWAEIGVPESADKYEFKTIEDIPETEADIALRAAIAPAAHKAKLAPWQLEPLNEAFNEHVINLARNAEKTAGEHRSQLQSEWGGEFDGNIAKANRVVRAAFGEEAAEAKNIRLSDGRFLLDDAGIAKAFAMVGDLMGEDGELPGAGQPGGQAMAPAAAEAEIERIRAEGYGNEKHPLNDQNHPEHEALHKRLSELYRYAEQGKNSGATV